MFISSHARICNKYELCFHNWPVGPSTFFMFSYGLVWIYLNHPYPPHHLSSKALRHVPKQDHGRFTGFGLIWSIEPFLGG